MRERPETAEIQTFVRAVEARSISRAARELGVPRPTVGRRLARLEAKLGVRLLRRSTRTMALTDAGEVFYARARAVLAAVDDATESVVRRDDSVRGVLRVSTPPMQSATFALMLADFTMRYPDVRLELHASTKHVDLITEGYDVALRAGTDLSPGLVARRLSRSRLVAVASRAYLAAHPAPRRVSDLAQHACLAGFERGEHPANHWPLLRGGRVRVGPVMWSNEPLVLLEAVRRGRGIGLMPLEIVYDELQEGSLVPVLAERIGAESVVALVYPDREFVSPALRAFIDAVVVWAATDPYFSRKIPGCEEAKANQRAGKVRPTRGSKPTARSRRDGFAG